ncbi:hypothetical protein LEN26_011752 [Aphanomyces euteiches]|nr:hypothetical protein LEN26_011752 [Aphanomyces euteiches]
MSAAAAAVQDLLMSHMGFGPRLTYRHLFSSPEFTSLQPKQELLERACSTGCAAVVDDVLLFLSHTLSDAMFHRELRLSGNALALDQWANYLRQQQRINHGSTFVSLQDYPLIALFRGVGRYADMAMEIMQLILNEPNRTLAMDWAAEAGTIFQRTRQPEWLQTQLAHYVHLERLLADTEARDGAIAPHGQTKAGMFDQRSFTQGLNWHKRHFTLEELCVVIRKHEPDKVERSANPFLDKREERVMLTIDMKVTKRHHESSTHAKQLARPYCIEIAQQGRTVLLMDMWSETAQLEWLDALQANITRLGLASVWRTHPRPCVLGMSVAQFVRYCLLYPDGSAPSPSSSKDEALLAWQSPRVRQLSETFDLDPNRLLYLSILYCGETHGWDALQSLTQPGKVKRLFTSQPQSTIGFGAFVDTAIVYKAPRETVELYKALFLKQNKGWTSLQLASSSAAPRT